MRARPTIFRRTDGAIPELEPPDGQPPERLEGGTGSQRDSPTAKPPRIKATFYLTHDDIVAIDTLQTEEFKRTGKKPERSELVSRAVQLLRQQDG
jgi:hypothetical protein